MGFWREWGHREAVTGKAASRPANDGGQDDRFGAVTKCWCQSAEGAGGADARLRARAFHGRAMFTEAASCRGFGGRPLTRGRRLRAARGPKAFAPGGREA